jgi:hypothetical protein
VDKHNGEVVEGRDLVLTILCPIHHTQLVQVEEEPPELVGEEHGNYEAVRVMGCQEPVLGALARTCMVRVLVGIERAQRDDLPTVSIPAPKEGA